MPTLRQPPPNSNSTTTEETSLLLNPTTASPKEQLNFPPSVFYILGTEFCERFSYYGTSAILYVYLSKYQKFEDDSATASLHFFKMACYTFTLVGAYLGDRVLGKFKTICYLSIIYSIGFLILSVTSIPGIMDDGPFPLWSGMLTGLGLIAFGTGGIKPCVSAFGGDQLDPVTQGKELAAFFALFYFIINCGSVLSMIITPFVRQTHCFGGFACFPLAFFIPFCMSLFLSNFLGLMIVATGVFIAGSGSFKKTPITTDPRENTQVLGVCWSWITSYFKQGPKGFEAGLLRDLC
jgi:dipeptide/tripeptide permease